MCVGRGDRIATIASAPAKATDLELSALKLEDWFNEVPRNRGIAGCDQVDAIVRDCPIAQVNRGSEVDIPNAGIGAKRRCERRRHGALLTDVTVRRVRLRHDD